MSEPDAADEEFAEHRRALSALSGSGRPLDAEGPWASVRNPAWFLRSGTPRHGRRGLHARLLDERATQAPDVLEDRRAVVLAGAPGAGKSSSLEQVLGERRATYVVSDPDEFKRLLLRQALQDGSYEAWFCEPLRRAGADPSRRRPMELASLMHRESSSLLARLQRQAALRDGENLVVDGVLAELGKARQLLGELADARYRVQVVAVDAPPEVAAARVAHRHEQGRRAASEGGDVLGGRAVPSEEVRRAAGGGGGESPSVTTARQVAHEQQYVGVVDALHVYRVDGPVAQPRLVESWRRPHPGGRLMEFGFE